jgi:hypothetical protein
MKGKTWEDKKSLMESHNKQFRHANWTPECMYNPRGGRERHISLVWITKAFNLEWLLNLWERGIPQNKPSKKRAVTQLENANLTDTKP